MNNKNSQIQTGAALNAFDQATDCQENIAVIAELLEANGAEELFGRHDARIFSGVARLLTNEARRLQQALEMLETHYPRAGAKKRPAGSARKPRRSSS